MEFSEERELYKNKQSKFSNILQNLDIKENFNLSYYLNEKHVIQKQLKTCDKKIVNIEMKSNKK